VIDGSLISILFFESFLRIFTVQSNKQNAFESNSDFLKANTQIGNQMQVTVEISYSVTNHMLWNWFPNLFLKHHRAKNASRLILYSFQS
jgi:hypothetical protein